MTIGRSAVWGGGAWWERCYWWFSIMSFGRWRNSLHVGTEAPRAASRSDGSWVLAIVMLVAMTGQICPIGWRFSDWNTSSVRPAAQ
jgi:hypothetical protein